MLSNCILVVPASSVLHRTRRPPCMLRPGPMWCSLKRSWYKGPKIHCAAYTWLQRVTRLTLCVWVWAGHSNKKPAESIPAEADRAYSAICNVSSSRGAGLSSTGITIRTNLIKACVFALDVDAMHSVAIELWQLNEPSPITDQNYCGCVQAPALPPLSRDMPESHRWVLAALSCLPTSLGIPAWSGRVSEVRIPLFHFHKLHLEDAPLSGWPW